MPRTPIAPPLLAALLIAAVGTAARAEFRGELGLEGQAFAQAGAQGQARDNASLRLRPSWWHDAGDDQFALALHARADAMDESRTHLDLREASWLRRLGEHAELRAGLRQVFWGVTEGTHLVDIVNQADGVDALDGEQKLGQPMLGLGLERGPHVLDVYALLGARERTFAGRDGRLRLPLVTDDRLATFESSNGRDRVDVAARYQFNDAGLRLGLSLFGGSAREPELHPVVDPAQLLRDGSGNPVGFAPGYAPVLAPFYPVIAQAGLDAQYTAGDWLWKLEAIERVGQLDPYAAADAGVEFTQVGVFGTAMDVGWIAEYLYDERDDVATTPFEHDVLLGARLAFNDAASSALLASAIVDHETQETLLSLEGSRRLGDALTLSLEARVFTRTPPPQDAFAWLFTPDSAHKLRPLADDDFLRLDLTWFF